MMSRVSSWISFFPALATTVRHRQRQRGMALIVVLWMLAALSLFVASLGSQVRDQASQALVQRHLAQGRAAGEAAILLALQQLQQAERNPGAEVLQVAFAGQVITVRLQPWAGLVNINRASDSLLAAVLMGAAQLPRAQAQALAHAIVQRRQEDAQDSRSGPWETTQDLLTVPGMTYPIYLRLQPYLVASADSRSTVAQETAPQALRTWLQAAAPEQLHASADNGRLYTVTAQVLIPDQGSVLVQRPLVWSRQASTGLPWVLLATTTIWQPAATD